MSSIEEPFWRSLDEVADTPEFRNWLHREFPEQASENSDPLSRRNFLKLMGASFALMGLNACTGAPFEKIVPYVKSPERLIPGRAQFYASVLPHRGFGRGVLVESHEGRPTKIEGNPDHPQSLGAADAAGLAEILNLYDPDRLKMPKRLEQNLNWDAALAALQSQLAPLTGGAGLTIWATATSSPTLIAARNRFRARYPKARWLERDPLELKSMREASLRSYNKYLRPLYDFSQAEVVLAIQGDFLGEDVSALRNARDFIDGRRVRDKNRGMNRLYSIESALTLTGARADHRLPLTERECARFMLMLASELGLHDLPPFASVVDPARANDSQLRKWAKAIAKDLQAHNGRSLIYVGEQAAPALQTLAHTLNERLGNRGKTFDLVPSVAESSTISTAPVLNDFINEIKKNQAKAVLFLDTNPLYTEPTVFGLTELLAKIPLRIQLTSHLNETSEICEFKFPISHALESWGDLRAVDGTASLQQPLIRPLYATKSEIEFLSLLSGDTRPAYQQVREQWKNDARWEHWLERGVIDDTKLAVEKATLDPLSTSWAVQTLTSTVLNSADGVEVHFAPDPISGTGKSANNGWLQELPRPLTSICWGNAALISPADAEHWKVANDQKLHLSVAGRSLEIPAFIQPGVAPGTVHLHLGHGRRRAGKVGEGVGTDVSPLRSLEGELILRGADVAKGQGTQRVLTTQSHHSMEGRDIVRTHTTAEFPKAEKEQPPSLMPGKPTPESKYAWGMSIDLNACIGCKACVMGCQSENNSPVVGADQVGRGREMHWLRVDTYFRGEAHNPEVFSQPVPCMHCEQAPCEVVCPVAATAHDSEGLNDMVYNRCVGTRYCSNNCPYKVRRFNFLQFQDTETPVLKLMRNPNVTVRSRGVMEKCTYCVQRITVAHQNAELEDRSIRDGEIKTACQTACPTNAIVFGNIKDPKSEVTELKEEPANYSLLGELGTRPRTTYLGHFRNANPELG